MKKFMCKFCSVYVEHILFPVILSGFSTFIIFLIVLLFSSHADWDYLICLTIFGALGYELGNILALKFPRKNSDIWPMTGMFEGWLLGLMLLLRVSMHSI